MHFIQRDTCFYIRNQISFSQCSPVICYYQLELESILLRGFSISMSLKVNDISFHSSQRLCNTVCCHKSNNITSQSENLLCIISRPPGWGYFCPQWHYLNKLGRGSLDDASNIIIKALAVLCPRRGTAGFPQLYHPCPLKNTQCRSMDEPSKIRRFCCCL